MRDPSVDPGVALERKVRQRVHDDESHWLVAAALTEVAVAAMHPARHFGVARSATPGMLEDPIERATQAAIEELVLGLEDLVDSLPRSAIDALAGEQVMADIGQE
jgi:hypothetical protein